MFVLLWLVVQLTCIMADELNWYVIEDRTNFSSAITACQSKGFAGLAVLDTAEKFRLAMEYINYKNVSFGEPWVGLRYFQNWKDYFWNTGDRASSLIWRMDEPDYADIQLCVRLRRHETRPGLGTSFCYAEYFALCERYETVTEEQRMYVRLGKDIALLGIENAQRWLGFCRTYTECCFKCEEDPQCVYIVYNHELGECKTLDKTFRVSQTIVKVGFTIGGKFVSFRATAEK